MTFFERGFFLTRCVSGVSSAKRNKLLWWPVSREVISRWCKNAVSSLAESVQVSHLQETVILGFPPTLVFSLDFHSVFAGIFCSYFFNEVLKVDGVGSAKLIFQGVSHLFLGFFFLNLFHLLSYICQPSRAVVQVHSQAGQPDFGGASHCSAKGRLMPKMSNHLFSELLQDVGLCFCGCFFSRSSFVFAVG